MWVEDKTAPAAEPKDLWISENEAFWPFPGRAEADVSVGQYLLWIWAIYMGCYSLPHPHITVADGVKMDCSDHGNLCHIRHKLKPQFAAPTDSCWRKVWHALAWASCAYTRCCLHPAFLLTVLILIWKRLTIEAVVHGNLRAAVSRFRPWKQACC